MPNWCNNNITINGKRTKEIYQTIQNELNRELKDNENEDNRPGLLSLFVPIEEDDDWYEKHCVIWGTKWDIPLGGIEFEFEEDIDNDNNKQNYSLNFNCESAWSPFNQFLVILGAKYDVNITNTYSESGADFYGLFTYTEGETEDKCYEYYEGMYILDYYAFWDEVDYCLDWNICESLEEYLEKFSFFNEEDKVEFTNIYNNYQNRIQNEDNEDENNKKNNEESDSDNDTVDESSEDEASSE